MCIMQIVWAIGWRLHYPVNSIQELNMETKVFVDSMFLIFFFVCVCGQRIEREMLQKLEKEEENTGEIASTFSSLQQEVEAKTKKLKKLFAKLQSIKQEIGDLHDEFCRDRADLQQTQDELTRFV